MNAAAAPGLVETLRRHSRRVFAGCVALMAAGYAWMIPWHARAGFGPLPDWALAIDLLVVLPLVWLALQTPPRGRTAWLGALAVAMAGIWVGAWALPEENKLVWLWLEPLRWVVVGAVLMLEVALLALAVHGVALAWRQRRRVASPGLLESDVHHAMARRLGTGALLAWWQLEARMWLYALTPTRHLRGSVPAGERWFSVHRHGQNASNQLGFVILAGAEIPIAHGLLHLWFGPWVAGVATALSVWGWIFLFAEWRASRWRPVSLSATTLHLRHGLMTDVALPRCAVLRAEQWRGAAPRRAGGRLNAIGMGRANLRLELAAGTELATLTGRRHVHEVFIGIDEPERLLAALRETP
jgi:hypothetical protein